MRQQPAPPLPRGRRQRGVTLIEAMVAMVIMAFGMVALIGLQGQMRRSADLAKQRGEALRLAQQQMEQLRSFSVLTAQNTDPPDTLAFDDIVTPDNPTVGAGDPESNAVYTLTRTVTPVVEQAMTGQPATVTRLSLRVIVEWIDRANDAQRVQLDSFINRAAPGLSGSLTVPPSASPTRRPGERVATIPTGAKDLGQGTSVFVPGPNATVAWVFNNYTGMVVGVCTNIAMGTSSASLNLADVSSCSGNASAVLLSGFVRYSFASPPDSAAPASSALALPLQMAISALGGSPAPVPASAHQCFDDAPASGNAQPMPFVSYYCIVYPNTAATPPSWSGRLDITGLPLGGSNLKICRYTADYDGNGTISNNEHPLDYLAVTGSLSRQNFLVVRATDACPAGHRVDPSQGYFSDTRTLEHQPQPSPSQPSQP